MTSCLFTEMFFFFFFFFFVLFFLKLRYSYCCHPGVRFHVRTGCLAIFFVLFLFFFFIFFFFFFCRLN